MTFVVLRSSKCGYGAGSHVLRTRSKRLSDKAKGWQGFGDMRNAGAICSEPVVGLFILTSSNAQPRCCVVQFGSRTRVNSNSASKTGSK